jgi:hypothetical protein
MKLKKEKNDRKKKTLGEEKEAHRYMYEHT